MAIPEQYRPFVDDIHGMIRLSEADFELFRKHRSFFESNGGALVDAIAAVLMDHPMSRAVFEEGRGDLESLKTRLGSWIGRVIEGHDTPDFWHDQFVIAIEHIVRRIPNRQMVGLASRIREALLPMMLEQLGAEEGLGLFLAFQRMLDSIVALTTTLVDEGQRRCLLEATGFTEKLADNLQSMVFARIRKELESS